MLADLKPYSEHKEAGLPWLDSIPKHWEMIPNRALMQEQRKVVGKNAADYTLLSLTLGGIIPRNMETPKGKFPAQFNTYKVVRPEDLVFCLFDIDETPRGVGHSKLNGMITGAYDVFTPKARANARYLYLYYLFLDEGKLLKPLYAGLRKTIRPGDFASLKTPCPKPDEQDAIVRFLDHANGRIERAIRAKKKLIALLHEQKQAIIHRAVTRGLDPDIPLKASGIPSLGDIPKHWKAIAFARLSRVIRGASPRPAGDKRFFYGDFMPWLTVGEVTKDQAIYLEKTDFYLTRLGVEHSVIFPKGTLVLTNSGATLGVPKILAMDVCANDGVVALTHLAPILNPVFAYYYLSTLTVRLRDELRQGGTQPNLNVGIIRNIVCPIPSESEQTAILEFLEAELKTVRVAIDRAEREIELLREYRTRLVADVVTGKLDVRATARNLPDAAEPATSVPDESEEAELIEEEKLA